MVQGDFEREDFEPTPGLLQDVMTKQAGSLEKAILEAVMNAVDADAGVISIQIEDDKVTIQDDGKGMKKEEIDEYFKKFGLKADDIEKKDFGKFRMGRGQIFNFGLNIWHTRDNVMVVNLQEDETVVDIEGETYTLDTSDLGYQVASADGFSEGCDIEIHLDKEVEDVVTKFNDVKKLIEFIPWVHDVDIVLNGEKVYNEPQIFYETELAWFLMEPNDVMTLRRYSKQTQVYNQGAYVKEESLGEVQSVVISKVDLDVNFARNDILDNDNIWSNIKEQYSEIAKKFLLEKDEFSERESVWLLENAVDDAKLLNQISDKEIIFDVTGRGWSIEDLQEEDISFSHTGNKMAEDMMKKTGTVILKEKFSGKLHDLIGNANFLKYAEVVEDKNTFEMSVVQEEDLSKKRGNRLKQARWLLREVGFEGQVKAGFSKHANVWKDGEGTVFIHKGLLNEKKMEFLTVGLHEIVEVAAQKGDTREGRNHGLTFRKKYWKYMENFPEAQKRLLQGSADYSKYGDDIV